MGEMTTKDLWPEWHISEYRNEPAVERVWLEPCSCGRWPTCERCYGSGVIRRVVRLKPLLGEKR